VDTTARIFPCIAVVALVKPPYYRGDLQSKISQYCTAASLKYTRGGDFHGETVHVSWKVRDGARDHLALVSRQKHVSPPSPPANNIFAVGSCLDTWCRLPSGYIGKAAKRSNKAFHQYRSSDDEARHRHAECERQGSHGAEEA